MLKIALLCFIFGFGFVSAFSKFPTKGNNIKSDLSFNVLTPKELEKYLVENPNVIELKPQPRNTTAHAYLLESKWIFTYGIRSCEEEFLAVDWMTIKTLYKQDLQSEVIYPRSGVEGLITFVFLSVDVNASGAVEAYIASGGIGQRYIKLIITGYDVDDFYWLLNVYGYRAE